MAETDSEMSPRVVQILSNQKGTTMVIIEHRPNWFEIEERYLGKLVGTRIADRNDADEFAQGLVVKGWLVV